MKKLMLLLTVVTSMNFLASCGESKEEKKELTVCDCLEDGKVVQTDECREIAMHAKMSEFDKCK